MCAFGGFENESSRAILNFLKFVSQLLRNSWQHGITAIKTWQYRGCHKGFGSINCEYMSNLTHSKRFHVGRLTYFTNLLFHGELVLKSHTQILDWSWETNIVFTDVDWEWKIWWVLRINEQCLSFSFVELWFVLRRTVFYISYTWLHVTDQHPQIVYQWSETEVVCTTETDCDRECAPRIGLYSHSSILVCEEWAIRNRLGPRTKPCGKP